MQDNIRVTAPIPHNDTSGRIRPSKETPIQNPIDITKVTPRTNAENAQQAKNNQENFNFLLNHGSVFNKFIQQLSQTPGLAETLKKIMFEAFSLDGKVSRLSRSETMNTLMAKLSETLKMSPEEIVAALQYQDQNQTKFSGKMFDMLRELLNNNQTNREFETLLGRFLKAYNGYFSTADTSKGIVQNLKNIAQYMPKSWQTQLNELTQKLFLEQPERDLNLNLTTLKNEIIPFLSEYITKTNDFGRIRDTITLLINNIARLNNSSRDDVITTFIDLMDFCKFKFDFPDTKIDQITRFFQAQLNNPEKNTNELFEVLADVLSEGSSGDQPAAARAIFRDITSALLLDNSVFMPLTHLFLPLNFKGTYMFSEIWVEKDARQKDGTYAENGKVTNKLFLTFDIKGLGYFECTIWASEDKADIDLNYPSTLLINDRDIRNNLARIFANNHIELNSISLIQDHPAQPLQKVFSNIFQTRRGIDVTI